jgi:Trp operon repressor
MKRIVNAFAYAIRSNGGTIPAIRAAFLLLRHEGVSGILRGFIFSIRHSAVPKSEPYRRVSEFSWLEDLVVSTGEIEPDVLQKTLLEREELPVYFHRADSAARLLEGFLARQENHAVVPQRIEIASRFHAIQYKYSSLSDAQLISNSSQMFKRNAVIYRPKNTSENSFHEAILQLILTLQPSTLIIRNCRLSKYLLDFKSLISLNTQVIVSSRGRR